MVRYRPTVDHRQARDDWLDDAECRRYDSDAFFPAPSDSYGIASAKLVCQDCCVRTECLILALSTNDAYAVMGGMSPVERGRLIVANDYSLQQAIVAVREGTIDASQTATSG